MEEISTETEGSRINICHQNNHKHTSNSMTEWMNDQWYNNNNLLTLT